MFEIKADDNRNVKVGFRFLHFFRGADCYDDLLILVVVTMMGMNVFMEGVVMIPKLIDM